MPSWLRLAGPLVLAGLFLGTLVISGEHQFDLGYSTAKAQGDKAVADLREQYATDRAEAAQDNLLEYRQQVTRANQAEERFLGAQDQIATLKQQLSERIAHVSTQYRPAPGAAAVPAPRFVVTCGWLRDYNLALGADLPAPDACRAASGAQETAWPAPGSDAELLESGVRAADILAHARDYGAWALTNLAHLNALLDVHDKETH
ncbi:lysis protein [Pseudomonas sp. 273]|uniref:lysis protein n=1 Tax=Pseudomonas sp. 273 TaxID=75692 RepID=UPI0023D8B030|nr:lysis protein [Pseudomonas sp. 273]